MRTLIVWSGLIILLTGCSFAPKYQRPPMPVPEHFKETGKWAPAQSIKPGTAIEPWWEVFHDPILNELNDELTYANQDLQVAYARYREARALVQVATAALFPSIQGLFNADRQQTSTTIANPAVPSLFNNVVVGAELNYEVDVWGSVRNAVAVSKNLARASEADLAAASLSLHAELVQDYLILRGYDESQLILDKTVVAYKKALYLTQKRYKGGASPIADVDEAETQYENARTLATDMRLKRAQMEHAIAVLVGKFPAHFNLKPGHLPTKVLIISTDLPSKLLERRPDISAAEFRVMAANANIGIARAAFFPVIDLTAIIGFQSQTLANLLSKPSLFWSLGPVSALTISQPIASQILFDGGRLTGLLKQAKAQYFETVGTYRQTVLTAFKEVEDSLVAIRRLQQENQSQSLATRSAKRALIQAEHRYTGGIITFLDVVILENTALQSELALVNIKTRRQMAHVQLIKALGGGWVRLRKG